MAVICSSGLVGKPVTLTALEKSPIMIVTGVEEEAKTVEVTWLDNNNSVNQVAFPSKALSLFRTDKAEKLSKTAATVKKTAPKKKK